jgi:hypothetical protein
MFYILFNTHEKNCKEYGRLYYFTDYYDPPYDCKNYEYLYLPDNDGKIKEEIPDYIWESCYLYFNNITIYKESAYDRIDEVIDRLIHLTYNTENYDEKIIKKSYIEKYYDKIIKNSYNEKYYEKGKNRRYSII